MRYLILPLLVAVLVALVLWASATPAAALGLDELVNVQGLTSFTAETNYMSRVGYARWQYWLDHNDWLSVMEVRRTFKASGLNPDAKD
jgi:hypothetical protein